MQAEHEAPVTSIGVSEDGLQIVLGTEAGSIGKLALLTQAYTPLLTSHTDTVHAVAAHPSRFPVVLLQAQHSSAVACPSFHTYHVAH